jgi:ankyrin repeat protein
VALLGTSCAGRRQPKLLPAAKAGELSKVKSLLDSGSDPDERGQHDWTAMMWAAREGHRGVVEALLDAGADPDLMSKRVVGNTMAPSPATTALREAVDQGHIAIANLLIDRGAKVDQTAFAMAGGVGDPKLLQKMLDNGADVNKPSKDPYQYNPSAMVVACSKGDLETVEWLISKGADAKLAPLKPALKGGNPDLLGLLLDAGADPNRLSGPDRTSPLQHAVILHTYGVRQDPEFRLVKLLLAKGADPSYAGSTGQFAGKTALELLVLRRNQADGRSNNPDYHVDRRNREAAHVAKMDELIRLLEASER